MFVVKDALFLKSINNWIPWLNSVENLAAMDDIHGMGGAEMFSQFGGGVVEIKGKNSSFLR